MATDADAARVIAALDLVPHPEGGWYRETFRAPAPDRQRSSVTGIYFLLEAGKRSHWHKVDAVETWCWHAGRPIVLETAAIDSGPIERVILGGDVLAGQSPQAVVPSDHWQAAAAQEGWTLVSCIVAPGFEFAGFVLAAAGWAPGPGPVMPAIVTG